ncbi:MAG TPA: hypothetical protein PKD86_16920 [Gemmatales bacterium]|nr:hypothetical protein [Gemmatales bacterium]HMP61028.1 hypothetical protein [Gemmatales bacterium]
MTPILDPPAPAAPVPGATSWREWATEALYESTTDRAAGLVANVVLLGPTSRNGYRYAAPAIERAAPLYEGRPVFIDHPSQTPLQRRLRDFAGQVVRARLDGTHLRGDVRLLGPNAGWLMDLIEAAPRDIGMSHVILGRRSPDGSEVLHIDRVLTVDIVAFPATTQSFREQAGWIDEPRSSLAVEAAPEAPPCRGPGHRAEPDLRWREFQALLEQSRVPAEGRQEALRQLLSCGGDPHALIAAMERYWDQVRSQPPRSAARQAPTDGLPALAAQRQAFIAAIRG